MREGLLQALPTEQGSRPRRSGGGQLFRGAGGRGEGGFPNTGRTQEQGKQGAGQGPVAVAGVGAR